MNLEFYPLHSPNSDQRLRHLERWASLISGRVAQEAPTQSAFASGSGSGQIPESEVIFDPDTGHTHEGGTSSLITLAGDVTGLNDATTVERIRNTPIPAPVGGNDQQFIKYDNGTTAFVYDFVPLAGDVTGDNPTTTVEKIRNVTIPAPVAGNNGQVVYYNHGGPAFAYANVSSLTMLGAWTHADISTLAVGDAEIGNSFAAAAAVLIANPMPRSGSFSGLTVKLTGDVGGAGNDLIVTVYKNGVASAVTVTILGGAGVENEATIMTTPVTFVATDDITVQAKIVGTPAAVRAVAVVWGAFGI